MKILIRKKYWEYLLIAVGFLFDVMLAMICGNFSVGKAVYIIFNVMILGAVSYKVSNQKLFEIIVIMALVFFYGLEVVLHYMHCYVDIDYKYLIIIPLFLLFIKSQRMKRAHENRLASVILLGVLLVNCEVALLSSNINFGLWIKSIGLYLVFLLTLESCARNEFDIEFLYKLVFYISILITVVQAVVGFNNDTRNAFFGVFGLGAYGLFLMAFPINEYSKYLYGKQKLSAVIRITLLTLIGYLATENKTGIILLVFNYILLAILSRKVSLKKFVIPVIAIGSIPILFRIVIALYPKFSFFKLSLSFFWSYIMGNSNWGVFKYGRFESLGIVFATFDIPQKIFGLGVGSSTSLNEVFYAEMGKNITQPYLARLFGENHGYALTGLATILLDGGFILLIPFLIFIFRALTTSLKYCLTKSWKQFSENATLLAVLSFFLYEFFYGNCVVEFDSMIMAGVIFGVASRIHSGEKKL